MRNIVYILVAIFLLVGCQEDNLMNETDYGVLSLGDINIQHIEEQRFPTKAVDSDLYVEIWQDGSLFKNNKFTPGNIPNNINLPVGVYTLVSYNQAYQEQDLWDNNQMGEPVFYKESEPFEIIKGEMNRQELSVPMANIGLGLATEESLPKEFYDYHLLIKKGDREISINPGQVMYLSMKEDGAQITYTLSAKNQDGESVYTTKENSSLKVGFVYVVTYEIQGLNLRELSVLD